MQERPAVPRTAAAVVTVVQVGESLRSLRISELRQTFPPPQATMSLLAPGWCASWLLVPRESAGPSSLFAMKRFHLDLACAGLLLLSGPLTNRAANAAAAHCPCASALMAPLAPLMPGPAGCAIVALSQSCGPCQEAQAPPLILPTEPIEPPLAEPCDPPTPVVKLRVRVPACGMPGQPVEYRIRVENVSDADAHHVVVKNALPPNAKFVRASPEPHATTPELEWRLGTMKARGGCDITLVLLPTSTDDLRNCTRVAFEHGQCVTTRLAHAPLPGDMPRPPVVVPIPKDKEPTGKEPPVISGAAEEPKLSLTIDGPKAQYQNLATKYLLKVTNFGKGPARNLLVDCVLADKLTFLKASHDGRFQEGKVAWFLGDLKAGDSEILELTVRATAPGELCLKGRAIADRGAKTQAEFCTIFGGQSSLSLEMSDREDPIVVGGVTSYPIVIRNNGTGPITNLRVKAIIPDSLTFEQAVAKVGFKLVEGRPGFKELQFETLATLEPGNVATYEVFVKGARPADARFKVEMRADQLEGGPVSEEESTRIYAETSAIGELLSRRRSRPLAYRP